MKKKFINVIIFIFLLTALFSCKERGHEPQKSSSAVLKMIEVPSVYSTQQARAKFIAEHFWDNTDFSDSAYLNDLNSIRGFYSNYIGHLKLCTPEIAKKSIEKFTDNVLNAVEPLKEFLLNMLEESLYYPNSRIRDEDLYICVLNTILSDETFSPVLKERYREQLEVAIKNRPGELALDFRFTTLKGREGSLYGLPKRYTLIMFYEPNCPACESAIMYLTENPVIRDIYQSINMIAVYTGEDELLWRSSSSKFNNYWIVAYNSCLSITRERLYDRRPSPSFYLLDKERRVILKDALPQEVVHTISKLTNGTL